MTPSVALPIVLALIVANGVFVASEFALVTAQRGVIEERAAAGDRGAAAALLQMRNLSFVLSGAQFGITATSVVVGLLAEDAVATLLAPLLERLHLPAATALTVSVTGAFVLSTIAQMVIGELFPKNLAIARPEIIAARVGRFMRAYEIVFGPVIRVFDRAAARLTRMLGVEPTGELLGGHSLDEISRIIQASGESGHLSVDQTSLLRRAVELGDRRVQEVLIPRPDVVWLQADDPAQVLLDTAKRTGHSRFPVYRASEDDVIGTVHVKDLLHIAAGDRDRLTIAEFAEEALVVPESHTLRRTLTALRRDRRTFAVVVDEYGGTAGIVTVEDILEELVGEIEDEFDRDEVSLRRLGAGRYVVRGSVRPERLEGLLGVAFPDGEFETIAGFVLAVLGRIPDVGDQFEHHGWEFTVTGVDGVRIAELRLRRLPVPEVDAIGAGS